jgi:hypothetical protein
MPSEHRFSREKSIGFIAVNIARQRLGLSKKNRDGIRKHFDRRDYNEQCEDYSNRFAWQNSRKFCTYPPAYDCARYNFGGNHEGI